MKAIVLDYLDHKVISVELPKSFENLERDEQLEYIESLDWYWSDYMYVMVLDEDSAQVEFAKVREDASTDFSEGYINI